MTVSCFEKVLYHLVAQQDGGAYYWVRTACGSVFPTRGKSRHDRYWGGTPLPVLAKRPPAKRRLCKSCRRGRQRARAKDERVGC
jgi:hypothetical protein